MSGEKVDKRISIREDQDDWLDENEWFNLSGAVRDTLDDVMENHE